jgi:hypothetical protein
MGVLRPAGKIKMLIEEMISAMQQATAGAWNIITVHLNPCGRQTWVTSSFRAKVNKLHLGRFCLPQISLDSLKIGRNYCGEHVGRNGLNFANEPDFRYGQYHHGPYHHRLPPGPALVPPRNSLG